ncbi:MAG: efflux transporter outer membrane subunit [Pseudomonas sp.]|nr:efflux transporter outer membrane subunit [Pseudomonas sp.]
MPAIVRPGLFLASLLVTVFSSLTGCIASGGIAPQAELADNAELPSDAAIRHASQAADWPRAQWWQAYGDAQLNAWVARALAGSPGLAMAAARVRRARALAGLAAAAQAPQVGLDASLQRKRWPDDNFYGPGPLARTTSWNNTAAFGLSYDLDLWGRLRSQREQALSQARVAATEERAAALELQGSVVRAYIQLARQYAELDIAKAELKQREELLALAEERRRIGLGTELEVSTAEAPLPAAHRQLDLAHEAITLSRNQLAALAGAGPGAAAELQRPRLALHGAPRLPSQLPLELLGRRPDVVASRWQVAAAARGIEVARADFYPNVDLLGSLGSAATQGGGLDWLRYDKLTWGIGPALSLPIFDGGARRSRLGAETAGYDLAVEQYRQTLVLALQGVADLLVRLHSLHEQQGFAAHALATAERRWQLAQEAHARGLTDAREALAAQGRVFAQQRLQQQVLAAQLAAQAELWVALGGGVLAAGSDPADSELQAREVHLQLPGRP